LGKDGIPSAVVTQDSTFRLRVVRVDGAKGCSTGPLSSADAPNAGTVYDALDNEVSYNVYVDAKNTSLHLMDEHCRESLGPFANATLIGRPSAYQPPRFVILTGDQKVLELHPETKSESVIAKDVTSAVLTNTSLYTLEASTVKVRDRSLQNLRSFGDGVTEMHVDKANDRVAFVDGTGLHYVLSKATAPVQVDSSGCHVGWADATADVTALQYEKSCTDPTLVIAFAQGKERIELPSVAARPVAVRNFGSTSSPQWVLSYFSDVNNVTVDSNSGLTATIGRRFMGSVGEDAKDLGSARTTQSIGPVTDGKLLLWLDPDTTNSRVVEWSPKGQSDNLKGVVDFTLSSAPARALVKSNQGLALFRVTLGAKPTLVLDDAYGFGVKSDVDLLLFSNVSKDTGKVLRLASGSTTPELLFESAYVPSVQLTWGSVAVATIEHYSVQSGWGDLCVRLIETADTFCQSNVTSYLPSLRPTQGIAYVSESGGKYSLYWAVAQ
jgi:hypothetical protein